MSDRYADSDYAFERVGAALCCEPDEGWDDIEDGDCPKCRHCRDGFEFYADDPKPCIERIAAELERLRGVRS